MAVTRTTRRKRNEGNTTAALSRIHRRWIGTLLMLAFSSFYPNTATITCARAFLPTTTRVGTRTITFPSQNGNHNRAYRNIGRTRCYLYAESDGTPLRDPTAPSSAPENEDPMKTDSSAHAADDRQPQSRITSIRCQNFAGMTSGKPEDDGFVVLEFEATTADTEATIDDDDEDDSIAAGDGSGTHSNSNGNLVCITGETGSGKSLLVSKIADLLTGGKASASMIHDSDATGNTDGETNREDATPPSASVEMVLSLRDEAHQTFVRTAVRRMGLEPSQFLDTPGNENENENENESNPAVTLRLRRVITAAGHRLKSNCFVNDRPVTLKVLRAVASPLVAIVNAPVAAAALGRPASRMNMIDSGIPSAVLVWVRQLQTTYRRRKKERESLEDELDQQVLPASMVRGADDDRNEQQFDLLRHWIEELDGFERRISDVKESFSFDGDGARGQLAEPELMLLLKKLDAMDWAGTSAGAAGTESDSKGGSADRFSSSLYETLLDLHDYLKALDARILAATEARDSLASLSASDSARTALDRTRQLLLDTVAAAPHSRDSDTIPDAGKTAKSRVALATERAHEMLNLVEDALLQCSDVLDDDEKGLIATLRASRKVCSVSTEELLDYITEWNTLGRKHGVPPYQLPLCHETLKNELNGGVEAARLLPEAKIAEQMALDELKDGCRVLSKARSTLCQRISASITRRLPRLGMENSKFEARLSQIENPSYAKSQLGADEVDFFLLHDDKNMRNSTSMTTEIAPKNQLIGGKIETVASSGEKARILLAIECEIPGSISAIGGASTESVASEEDEVPSILPVAVIYDEIDAHVGGRASISVAQMLFDQSKACQVLSITHSPSLAAIADTHICVHRGKADDNGRLFDIVAKPIFGVERRKELARMASGDMVADEAEVFAEALLRDASSIKGRSQKRHPSD